MGRPDVRRRCRSHEWNRYHLSWHGGPSNTVGRYKYDAGAKGHQYDADSYSTSPDDPFGASTAAAVQASIYATYTPAAVPPVNVTTPVSGNAWVGQTLTITDGDGVEDWTGEDSLARQWQRETGIGTGVYADIAVETADTYLLANADRVRKIRAAIIVTNGSGSTTAYSAGVGPIGVDRGPSEARLELQTEGITSELVLLAGNPPHNLGPLTAGARATQPLVTTVEAAVGRPLRQAEQAIDVALLDQALREAKDAVDDAIVAETLRAVKQWVDGWPLTLQVTDAMLAPLDRLEKLRRSEARAELDRLGYDLPARSPRSRSSPTTATPRPISPTTSARSRSGSSRASSERTYPASPRTRSRAPSSASRAAATSPPASSPPRS